MKNTNKKIHFKKGLNKQVIIAISQAKNEPK